MAFYIYKDGGVKLGSKAYVDLSFDQELSVMTAKARN